MTASTDADVPTAKTNAICGVVTRDGTLTHFIAYENVPDIEKPTVLKMFIHDTHELICTCAV